MGRIKNPFKYDDLKPVAIWSQKDLMKHEMSRMAGFLDCLKFLATNGLPEQAYVDYLSEKTKESAPLVDWLRVKIKEKV